MRHVVQHVAALAEAAEVAQLVVGWVAVEVRGGEHDAGGTQARSLDQIRPATRLTPAIAPGARRLVEPTPVWQAAEPDQMRAPAGLAASAGALEPDPSAQFALVRRVEAAELATDRHDCGSLSGAACAPHRSGLLLPWAQRRS
jgi:hypothetical protein